LNNAAERKHKLPDGGVFHNRFILKKQNSNRQDAKNAKFLPSKTVFLGDLGVLMRAIPGAHPFGAR